MAQEPKFETVGLEHPVTNLANALADEAPSFAAKMGISKMDVCSAMANAIGFILADASKPGPGGTGLPREKALARMDHLRTIMQASYELREVKVSTPQ